MDDRVKVATAYIVSLGGSNNIEYIEACSTRVRVIVKELALVCNQRILELGAFKVIQRSEQEIHIVLGMTSELLVGDIKKILHH